MTALITTSTSATATAYPNQRKIDRTSNGVLWAFWGQAPTGTATIAFPSYSLDNGKTWTTNYGESVLNGSTLGNENYVRNFSAFIDQDDYAHVVFKDNSNGFIYYRRGTPSAERTSWTWSGVLEASGTNDIDSNYPDVIAHREGTGWKAHIVFSKDGNGGSTAYSIIDISSTGTLTLTNRIYIGSGYAGGTASFPSIDFNHTGDGKTIKDGTPHLYVAWSAGATGAGRGIRFKKATYSGGTWTWGTEREIDPNHYFDSSSVTAMFINCIFDGTGIIIGGFLSNTVGNYDTVLYERNVADTVTTALETATWAQMVTGKTKPYITRGQITYDNNRNIHIPLRLAQDSSFGTAIDIGVATWTRSTSQWSFIKCGTTQLTASNYVSAKRGYSGNRIEFIYTDGTASPYSVTYDSITLNTAPTALFTTAEGQKFDPRLPFTVSWNFSDDDGNAQADYALSYRVAGSGAAFTSVTSIPTNKFHTFPENYFADETGYELKLSVSDGIAWSSDITLTVTADSWTYLTETTSANNFGQIDTTPLDFGQYEVQVRVSDQDDAGNWSLSGEFFYEHTDHYVYVNGAWTPVRKKFSWIGQWKDGEPTNF